MKLGMKGLAAAPAARFSKRNLPTIVVLMDDLRWFTDPSPLDLVVRRARVAVAEGMRAAMADRVAKMVAAAADERRMAA
jgi:hypothetical protein